MPDFTDRFCGRRKKHEPHGHLFIGDPTLYWCPGEQPLA